MARPIMPTPEVTAQDAEDLRASLDTHASPAEMKRRAEAARAHLEEVMRTKGPAAKARQDDQMMADIWDQLLRSKGL